MNNGESTRQPRIALALGSGSARGLAHIGVIRGLIEIGIEPSIVCGTSIGALVGGAYASGHIEELDTWFAHMSATDVFRYLDINPLLRGGVGRAKRLIEKLREHFGSPRIEELPLRYAAVATDLGNGRELWIRDGDLWDAVRGSIAIPGLLSPARVDGHWVVDGGLVNPVPVSACRALGADLIIAVNLNSTLSSRSRARASQNGNAEGAGRSPGVEEEAPGIFTVIANAINIMQDRITRSRLSGEPADVMIAPRLVDIGLLDFESAAQAIEAGRSEVRQSRALIEEAVINCMPI